MSDKKMTKKFIEDTIDDLKTDSGAWIEAIENDEGEAWDVNEISNWTGYYNFASEFLRLLESGKIEIIIKE